MSASLFPAHVSLKIFSEDCNGTVTQPPGAILHRHKQTQLATSSRPVPRTEMKPDSVMATQGETDMMKMVGGTRAESGPSCHR